MRDMIAEGVAHLRERDRLAAQTPEVLYKKWHRPLNVGKVRVGKLTIGSDAAIYYGIGEPRELRAIPERHAEKIQAAETALREARQAYSAALKAAWPRARKLTVADIAAMGAEDLRTDTQD